MEDVLSVTVKELLILALFLTVIFFSKDGQSIGTQSFETKKFFKKIIFKPITSEDKYFSFIHYVESSKSLMKILKDNGISNSLKLSEQNRG